jgi:hypothetical protein
LNALRFVEVTVKGPKTSSLAAALHPEISTSLDEAQDKAAAEIVGGVAQHATTRVGLVVDALAQHLAAHPRPASGHLFVDPLGKPIR